MKTPPKTLVDTMVADKYFAYAAELMKVNPPHKGATPPADALWSITLYHQEGFQVANSLNRFAVSSWMPLQYNPDGSLDLYFQNANPGAEKEVDWLPATKGPFNLLMRIYAPKLEALIGKWGPPPVTRV